MGIDDELENLVDQILGAAGNDPLLLALAMSSLAMLLTTLGGSLVLFLRDLEDERRFSLLIDLGLGFSSGVMIVASFTSLLIPSIEEYDVARPIIGFLAGAATIHAVNLLVPHEHFVKGYEGPREALRKVKAAWLVALAIIIHNLPEGFSIGAASAFSPRDGVALGLAIGIQDVPEGLAVSIPVYASTRSKLRAILYAWLSGFSEVVLAATAVLLSYYSLALLPYIMGFGAGAMVYVVSHEALPETHRSGHEDKATLAFFLGFVLMLVLDTMIG